MEGIIVPKKKIGTHRKRDFDALLAAHLLKKEGGEKYPGIETAEMVFFDGIVVPGVIYVDCAESIYDHHPVDRFPNDCAATLVAKDLGIMDSPYYAKILGEVLRSDLKGGDAYLSIANIIKMMNAAYPENPERVVEWAFEAFEAEFNAQLDFHFSQFGIKDLSKTEVSLPGNLVGLIYAGQTENESFVKWAKYKGAAIVLLCQPSGNMQIFANSRILKARTAIVLDDIVSMLRVEEIWRSKRRMPNDKKLLRTEGKIEGVPEWYRSSQVNAIFNGSLTHPDTLPTKLSFEKVLAIVKDGLDMALPNKECQETVRCPGNRCRHFWYFLHRCRQLRYETMHKEKIPSPAPPTV